ncbi:hypothetical protein N9L68_01835 [bacterium]|nr:hypothetical protein [bacterium]
MAVPSPPELQFVRGHQWLKTTTGWKCEACRTDIVEHDFPWRRDHCPGAPPSMLSLAHTAVAAGHALWYSTDDTGDYLYWCSTCGRSAPSEAHKLGQRCPGVPAPQEEIGGAQGPHATRPTPDQG